MTGVFMLERKGRTKEYKRHIVEMFKEEREREAVHVKEVLG